MMMMMLLVWWWWRVVMMALRWVLPVIWDLYVAKVAAVVVVVEIYILVVQIVHQVIYEPETQAALQET